MRQFNTLTSFLLSKSSNPTINDTVNFQGYDNAGDGGNAVWIFKGLTGQAPSQQLGGGLLNDGNGNQWALVDNNVNIAALGGLTGDIAPALSAAANGSLSSVTVSNSVTCGLTQSNAQLILKYINNIKVDGFLSLTLDEGEINLTDFIDINNESATKINIIGDETANISVTAFNGVTGSVGNYLVTLAVADTSNVEVGNYLLTNVSGLSGTGRFKEIAGCWQITAKTVSSVTIKHTHQQSSFPVMTLSGTMRPLKSVLRWADGSRGLAIYNCDLNTIKDVVIAGSYDISTTPPSDGPDDGLLVGDQSNTSDTGSSQSRAVFAGSVFLNRVGLVEWPNNGLQCIGGSVATNGFSTCSNGHRGAQAAGNGFVNSKFSSSSGNGSSGIEAEASGVYNAAGSISAGNLEQGVYTIGNGTVVFNSNSYSGGNETHGLEAKDKGVITANTTSSLNNTITSVNVNAGFVTIESGETDSSVNAAVGGFIELNGATSASTYSADESSTIRLPGGTLYASDWIDFPALPTLKNVTYTDNGTVAEYKLLNGIVFWKIIFKYTGLDTGDVSSLSIGDFPFSIKNRLGDTGLKIRSSTGLTFATTDNFVSEYNTVTDSIVITDQAGQLIAYNGGKVNAAGNIELSGWYEVS